MRTYKLKELLSIKNGKDHKELKNGNIPIFGSGGIMRYGDQAIYNDESILLPRKGTLSNIQYVNKPFWTVDTIYYSVINKEIANPFYLFNFLKVLDLSKLNTGTGVPSMTFDSYYNLDILLPEIEVQQEIASVLSSLDSKIELNNRINAELEAMAKTLYDYWFVQFDFPNAKGKPYKTSGGKMVWNEELQREIPEGWEIEGIEKSCSIIDCLHSKKSELIYEDESSYLLQLENIKDDGLLDLTSKYYVTSEEYKRWTSRIEVKENDILITNAGRVAATAQMPKEIIAGIGRNITAIRPNSIHSTYLFLSFRGAHIQRQIKLNTDAGAFFTSFNVKGIKKLQILRPKNNIEEKFEEITYPIRQKRELNNSENLKLTELRDWLLPMLMNGQVKVN
jgi:type I restriction enzyme, S subunit